MPAVLLQTRLSAAEWFITLSAAAAGSQLGFVSDTDVLSGIDTPILERTR